MNIKEGTHYHNKTWRFLLPCMKMYGREFVSKLNGIHKLAVGVGDHSMKNTGQEVKRPLFIFMKPANKYQDIDGFKEYVKNLEFFVKYYETTCSGYSGHMFVFVIPAGFEKTYDEFLKGKYSNMYTDTEIDVLFNSRVHRLTKKILMKDKSARDKMVRKVNKTFGTIVNPSDINEGEFELPPKKKEEIFNQDKSPWKKVYLDEVIN